MGIVAPIVTTVGTVAGISAQQQAANQQRAALQRQSEQSLLELEVQKQQLAFATQAAGVRAGLEAQVAQKEVGIAREVNRQQTLSDALQVQSAKAAQAQAKYANMVNYYAGLTQALQTKGQATGLLQQSGDALMANAAGTSAAAASRSQGNVQVAQSYGVEAQPYAQTAQALGELGQNMLQSREVDARRALALGVDTNAGALSRVVQEGSLSAASRRSVQGAAQDANLQRVLAQRQFLQADLQQQDADRAGRTAGYLQQDARLLDSNVPLQERAAQLQGQVGNTILGYNDELLRAQEEFNALRQLQSAYDVEVGGTRNLLSIEQRNLANASQLSALEGQAAAVYGNRLSSIAANRAGIQNPNVLAGLINIGTAWTPYAMQQGWFSGAPNTGSSANIMGGGGWSPWVDVQPSYNNVVYA